MLLAQIALHTQTSRRFALELEFVQCLANPHYINWLAQHRYLDDPAFVRFLDYLQYWKQPEYAQFLTYVDDARCMAQGMAQNMIHIVQNPPHVHHLAVCSQNHRHLKPFFHRYPHALYFLDLLQDPGFRQNMASTTVKVCVGWEWVCKTCFFCVPGLWFVLYTTSCDW